MKSDAPFKRPSLAEALDAWKKLLAERGFATDIVWIFAENLCVEKSRAGQGGFRFGFQTRFTPAPEDALDIAFEHFCETTGRWFFTGSENVRANPSAPCCAIRGLSRSEADGFLRRDEWQVLFYPGQKDEIEEVTDLTRWLQRVKRGRAFHDLDFCMALEAIDEIKIYGRALAPYERFAAAMLNRLRRF